MTSDFHLQWLIVGRSEVYRESLSLENLFVSMLEVLRAAAFSRHIACVIVRIAFPSLSS